MPRTGLAFIVCAVGAWAAGQPWSAGDLWNWHGSSDARISPDGQWVVYVESWNDQVADASCSNLWAVSADGSQRIRLTDGAWRDWSPRWSSDGTRVAWIGERAGVIGLRVSRRETRAETLLASADIDGFAWAPDGLSLAYTVRRRLFVVSAGGGTPRPVTGDGFAAVGEPSWMPDGKSILTASADGEIYSIRVSDGVTRRLTDGTGRNESPIASPDGAWIAWLATAPTFRSYAIRKLYVMNADGIRVKVLAGALDRDPADLQWSSDSRTVYFTAADSGATAIYAAHGDGSVRLVTRFAGCTRGLSLADNGRAVTVRSGEVVALLADEPSEPAVLSVPNAKLMAERASGAVEEIRFPSDGKSIQGWILKPPDFDASQKYPLLLDLADAPRRMAGPEFSLRAQTFVARGIVVLRINARGTPGYGEEFGALLPTRNPGDDADDLLRGVDYVVAKGYVDSRRLAIAGGPLAEWIAAHDGRFAAVLVCGPRASKPSLRVTEWESALRRLTSP